MAKFDVKVRIFDTVVGLRVEAENPAVRGRESASVPCTGVVREEDQNGLV